MCLRELVPTSAQPGALRADDDALLRVALDVEHGVDVDHVVAALVRQHLLDQDGDRVRQLVAHALERGLADQLGDHDRSGSSVSSPSR